MCVGGLPKSYKVAFSLLIAVYSFWVKANYVSALRIWTLIAGFDLGTKKKHANVETNKRKEHDFLYSTMDVCFKLNCFNSSIFKYVGFVFSCQYFKRFLLSIGDVLAQWLVL